jgi:hypothetical protein
MRRHGRWLGGLLMIAMAMLVMPKGALSGSDKPNILVIIGDDVGWFNIGTYNRGMMADKTSNIDKIAEKRRPRRNACPGADHCHCTQGDGLRHRPVREEPSRRFE